DFPTSNALQPTSGGGQDAFVAEVDATGKALLYSTYLGGSNGDAGYGIALDSFGNAYVTGSTTSPDFPISNALQPTLYGFTNSFVAKLSPSGTVLVYSTYLGRGENGDSEEDMGNANAVDGSGNVYVSRSVGYIEPERSEERRV